MNPSQVGNSGLNNKAPTAAQLQAFAEAEIGLAGMKRSANEVSDLEIPESSRPMTGLDKTRHRPNHPGIDSHPQPSPVSGNSSSPSTTNAFESPVAQQQDDASSAPDFESPPAVDTSAPSDLLDSTISKPSSAVDPSAPTDIMDSTVLEQASAVDSSAPRDVMDSTVSKQSSPATISPTSSNSRPLNSDVAPPSTITLLSGIDRRSPAVQLMLREAFNEGLAEGRQENEDKLDEAEAKVEELRKKLDPSKLKAAYERGWRDGGIAGFNKYSLNPETKPSDDRLAFEKICQEKDQAIHNQQVTMASYQKELMARKHRIEMLEQQVNFGAQHHPAQQQGQDISGQQISEAEARFSAQGQELATTKALNELMRQDLTNWQVQWGFITADLEKWKAAFNTKAEQLDACQRQLGQSYHELKESKAEADRLAISNSVKAGSLEAASEELESQLNVLSFDFNSLDRLYTTLAQAAAERSADFETPEWVQEVKDENDALTSKINDLAKLREQLEERVARQAEMIQDLSEQNEKLTKMVEEREEEDARALQNCGGSSSQAMDQPTEKPDDPPSNLAKDTAAAETGLVRAMLEEEREKSEAENRRREDRATATLEAMGNTERGRRQLLMDELEAKDAQIYDAQRQIRDLSERLLALSLSQPAQSPPSAPSSSSPPPETSQSPTLPPPLPPTNSTPSAAQTRFGLRPASHAETNFSPRRLVIILAIFLLTVLLPFLRSPSRPPSGNNFPEQVAVQAWQEAEDVSREEAYVERRRRLMAWAMTNWERTERIERGEEVDGREEEYRPLPNWNWS